MADRKYEFQITAADEGFTRSMDRIGAEAKQAGATVGQAFKKAADEASGTEAIFGRIKASLAGAFTVGAVVQFGRALANSVIEAERSTALLNSTLRATGYSAGLSGQQVEGLVQELAGLSTFDDDPIRQGVVSLLRFRDISGETFKEASRAAVDLAAATGKDLPSAFVAVGKALQDPATGMKGLREAGVKLSEGQQDLADRMKKAGDAAGAQKVVLDELAKSVGGAAAGEASGLYGSTRALANAWDDLLKTIGQLPSVASGSQGAISGLTSVINVFKRALESDAAPSGLSGSISIPGVSGKGPGKLGQLSAEDVQALRDASTRAGTKDIRLAQPKVQGDPVDYSSGTSKVAAMGAQMYLDQFEELQRQAKVILDEAKKTRLEIEQEIIKGISVGPEEAAKQQKAFEDLATKLVADTRGGKESAILAPGGELDSLNEALIKGKVNVEQYEQAYALLQDRLDEVRGVQKDFAKDLENDQLSALRAIENAVQGFGRQFTDTFADIVLGIEDDFGKLVQSIARDLLRLQINQSITQPAMAGLNGILQGFFKNAGATAPTVASSNINYSDGSPFTMGRPMASGGDVFPGMIYPINERGLEYFAPAVRGTVIPADGFRGGGGGGTTVVVNQYNDARADLGSIAALGRAQRRAIIDQLSIRR